MSGDVSMTHKWVYTLVLGFKTTRWALLSGDLQFVRDQQTPPPTFD